MSGDRIEIKLGKNLTINSGGVDTQYPCQITLSVSVDPATEEYQADSVSVEDVDCDDQDVDLEALYAEAEMCLEDWDQDITDAVTLYWQQKEEE